MQPTEAPKPVLPVSFAPSPEHLAQIAAAKRLGTKIRRASNVATIGGWTTAIFAAFTILFVALSWSNLPIGLGMAAISYFEFKGSAELKRLDPTAPKRLAINQLAFAVMIVLYGAYGMWSSYHQPIDASLQGFNDPQLDQMIGDVQGMTRSLLAMIYGVVIAVGIFGPGLTAVYYYSRRKFIEDYLKSTPHWIIDLQRAGMSL
jgi:hypothetical protein